MQFSCTGGTVAENQRVTLTIDRSQITGKAAGQFAVVNEHIQEGTGAANIIVEVDNTPVSYPKGTFVEANGCIAMEAALHCQAGCSRRRLCAAQAVWPPGHRAESVPGYRQL